VLEWSYLKPTPGDVERLPPSKWLKHWPLDDDLPINQGLSFLPQTAPDYLLGISFKEKLRSAVSVRTVYKDRTFDFLLVPLDQHRGNQQIASSMTIAASRHVDLAFIDQQVLIESDASKVEIALEDWPAPREDSGQQPIIKIDGIGSDVQFQGIRLYRDLHLRDAGSRQSSRRTSAWTVPKDCFFVLGDNPPSSVDSRNGLGMIPSESILGLLVGEEPASPR
jgi:hypothetical protein